MKKKRYVTIFPECEPVHLKKDVGMLPYSLGNYCEYDYSLVCYENKTFSEFDIEKFHIKTISKKKNDIGDFGRYLLKHAKEIDILNLYHISSKRNAVWIFLYKEANPQGKVHLKLDADYRMVSLVDMNPASLKGKLKIHILKNMVDLYTIESESMRLLLEDLWKIKMKIIPNGIFREADISPARVEDKQKCFLTVGRLGTEQKATEDLLSAFAKIKDKTPWNLILAGNIENNFRRYIDEYFEKNPDLEDRVIFTGNITNSEELTRLYKEASVFVLPSRWEGFALVLMEALECGDYLVVSDQVPSVNDISNNGKYADVFKCGDIDMLANTMLICTGKRSSNIEMEEMYKWIHDNFTWKTIAQRLDSYIKEIL